MKKSKILVQIEGVKGGAGSGNYGHSGRPGMVGGSGGRGAAYAPYSSPEGQTMYKWLAKRVPEKLLKIVGLRGIEVTEHPKPGEPGTLGYTKDGVVRVVEGDTKTLLHEVCHVVDLSTFGDKLHDIRTTLRDHPAMGNIGARERVAVFLESYHSDTGSRANDWVKAKFPDLIGQYESLLDAELK